MPIARSPDPVTQPPGPVVRSDRQTLPPDSVARFVCSTRPPTDAFGVCAYRSFLYSRCIPYTTICIRIYTARLGSPTRLPDPVTQSPGPAVRSDRQNRPPDSAARLVRSTWPPTDACGVCAYRSFLYSRCIQYTTICIRIYTSYRIKVTLTFGYGRHSYSRLSAIGRREGLYLSYIFPVLTFVVSSSAYFLPLMMEFHM